MATQSRSRKYPLDLGRGIEIASATVENYYLHTEKEHRGGYFPLGTNTVWHGGLHIHAKRGRDMVRACAAGEIVAARLFETEAQGHGHYGSVNFVLLKHHVSGSELNKANAGPTTAGQPYRAPFKDDAQKIWYSLYMHLNPESIAEANRSLKDVAWIRRPASTDFRITISGLRLREIPDGQDECYETLAKGAELRAVTPAPEAQRIGNYKWEYVEVVGGDAALAGRRGWVAAESKWVEPASPPVLDDTIAKQLKAGGVVRVGDAAHPVLVREGDPLWTVGEYGSPGYRAGLIHWEIFSAENLMPTWEHAVDTDDDYNMDCRQILKMVDQEWFGSDEILTKEEVENFYASDPDAVCLRRWACRFVIEWGIDLDKALPQLKSLWESLRTSQLKERITPYLWWDEAVSKSVPLPAGKKVWHYNPIALLAGWAGVTPVAAGSSVIIERDGAKVPFYAQADTDWGSRILGKVKRISAKGCALCCVAMVLAYYGRDVDPLSLDQHLDDNNGYAGEDITWPTGLSFRAAVGGPKLALTDYKFVDSTRFKEKIDQRIDENIPTIANVDYGDDSDADGNHWVVIVGRTEDGDFIMNDPGTAEGDGSNDPTADNTIQKTTRHKGMTIVRLMLFKVE
jgi:hypothetical protein